ncbi:MAG: hypothetical protein AB8G86_11500 [Saprospiraceae bacterium]
MYTSNNDACENSVKRNDIKLVFVNIMEQERIGKSKNLSVRQFTNKRKGLMTSESTILAHLLNEM